ncbi:MAG: hypothetical protein PWP24_422 [Clostridiales bacterium]|nr:hypothetical protein [Clostridiales bacterium]
MTKIENGADKGRIIIYGSKYGSSKIYALELSRRLGILAVSYEKMKDSNEYDSIIYIGGLYAGGVCGMVKTLKKWIPKKDSTLVILTVGLADPNEEKNKESIRKAIQIQLPENLFKMASIFHLRGGIDYAKLSMAHKMMMHMVYKKAKSTPIEEQDAEAKALIETYNQTVDFVDKSALDQVVEKMKEIWKDKVGQEKKDFMDQFVFRSIAYEEADQAVLIEQICFPPNEACSEKSMKERIEKAANLFLVAVDKESGKLAGFLNGVATNEEHFLDKFFTNANLHDPLGATVMLLGLDVLPEYRGQGLAREIMKQYIHREQANNRKRLVLTCLQEKIAMYEKMGFTDNGIANSTWGGEEWHEMQYVLDM